jgi:hypothetical protein
MRPLIALVFFGSIATSALAAGSDIRGLIDDHAGHTVISEQESKLGRTPIGSSFARYRYFGRGAAGFGHWSCRGTNCIRPPGDDFADQLRHPGNSRLDSPVLTKLNRSQPFALSWMLLWAHAQRERRPRGTDAGRRIGVGNFLDVNGAAGTCYGNQHLAGAAYKFALRAAGWLAKCVEARCAGRGPGGRADRGGRSGRRRRQHLPHRADQVDQVHLLGRPDLVDREAPVALGNQDPLFRLLDLAGQVVLAPPELLPDPVVPVFVRSQRGQVPAARESKA